MFSRVVSCLAIFLLASCGGGGGSGASTQPASPPPVANQPPADLKILVIGQSMSANCNAFIYGASAGVMQIGKDGSVKPAQDPFEWADCTNGSMWMPLGKRIIDNGVAKQVTFMPIGVGGSKVSDWQAGGPDFAKLNDALALIKAKGVSFDFAIWHQGSADAGLSRSDYSSRLLSVIGYVNQNVSIKSWLIGIHSRCWGNYDPEIEAAQRSVANAPLSNRYVGANTNMLGDEFRVDQCHLNKQGQEQAASLWLEAIQNAGISK